MHWDTPTLHKMCNYFSYTAEESRNWKIYDQWFGNRIYLIKEVLHESSYLPLLFLCPLTVLVWSPNIIHIGPLGMYFFAEIHPCLFCKCVISSRSCTCVVFIIAYVWPPGICLRRHFPGFTRFDLAPRPVQTISLTAMAV